MRLRGCTQAGGFIAGAVMVLLLAAPASAEIDGPCSASGDFFAGATTDGDPAVAVDVSSSETFEIPPSGMVDWQGAVQRGSEPRSYSGFVTIDTSVDDLFDFLSVDTELNTWDGTDETGNDADGIESYDIATDLIPGGAQIVVSGQHVDDGGAIVCSGSVTLALAGSPWSSPTTIASAAGSALFLVLAFLLALRGLTVGRPLGIVGTTLYGLVVGLLVGLVTTGSELSLVLAVVGALLGALAAVMTRRNGSTMVTGHPTPGWVLGLLGGLFLGVLGWALGLYPLDSPLLFGVPLLMTVAGFVAGLLAPLRTA